jgi:hypothetical protein
VNIISERKGSYLMEILFFMRPVSYSKLCGYTLEMDEKFCFKQKILPTTGSCTCPYHPAVGQHP